MHCTCKVTNMDGESVMANNMNLRQIPQPSLIWHHRAGCTIFLPVGWFRQINLLKLKDKPRLKQICKNYE